MKDYQKRKRISSSQMMCKYCKYPAIAILLSGFMYSLFAIGIYVGVTISDYTSMLLINHRRNGRTKYGYLHPTPPYKPVIRTSHTCNITSRKNNETIQEVVHFPVATPHLILIGVQKSGTSSFQSMIDKRINVITPLSVNKFEPHFFDFRAKNVLKKYNDHTTMEYKSKVCEKRKQYTEYFNMTKIILNNESVAIEKTPSYILYSNLPWMIDEVCPWAKIAVILRSPVDRACELYM